MDDLLKTLLSYLNSLSSTIEKENKQLAGGQIKEALKSLDKKHEILGSMQILESNIQAINKNSSEGNLEEKNPKLVARIKASYKILQEHLRQNEILLQSNIIVSNKLMEMYKQQRLEQTIDKFGYNKEGEISALKNLEKVMPAISLNNKV